MIMVPVVLSLFLFLRYGTETRGLDLRHLETPARNMGLVEAQDRA